MCHFPIPFVVKVNVDANIKTEQHILKRNILFFNFIEIAHRHGCSPVNLIPIFRTSFPKNTSGRLLLCNHSIKKFKQKLCDVTSRTLYKKN